MDLQLQLRNCMHNQKEVLALTAMVLREAVIFMFHEFFKITFRHRGCYFTSTYEFSRPLKKYFSC